VIEEGDRISGRFTCNEIFSKAFMGYQPNGTTDQMRSIDISRVKDGTVLVDREGRIAISHARAVDPLVFEADINALLVE
jgi:hypothetical protein